VKIAVESVRTQTIEVGVLGETPLIPHRMADKGLHELLFPRGRKTAADRAISLKHEPLEEYRSAATQLPDGPTSLGILATAFKGAMRTAALDMPGATKAEIGRLVYVEGDYIPIYGTPQIFLSVVRSSDPGRTPDVRTRPILPRWAAVVRIRFVVPILTQKTILNLMAGAGLIAGIGDWRPEKGNGSYGQFRLVNLDDPEFVAVLREGKAEQEAALATPQPYDAESAELLAWFDAERERRGRLEVIA
jgi:hypothetical protein